MGLIGWIKEVGEDVFRPLDKAVKALSSTTLYVYNQLDEPIYVLVETNADWFMPDMFSKAPWMASPIGAAIGGYSIFTAGTSRDRQVEFEMLRRSNKDSFPQADEYRAKVKASIKEGLDKFVKVEAGALVTVQEKATVKIGRLTASSFLGQASRIVKNEAVSIINESMTRVAFFKSNEDESWIVRDAGVVNSEKKNKRAVDSDGDKYPLVHV